MDIIQDLPKGKHNVIMQLSGGADSSIVYYALCDKFKDRDDVNIIVVTLDTDFKDQYIAGAKRIIDIVGKLTGKYPIEHFTNKIPHDEIKYVTGQNDLIHAVIDKYGSVTCRYSGLTMNPPIIEMHKFFKENCKKFNLDLDRVKNTLTIGRDISRDVFTKSKWKNLDLTGFPFIKLNKTATAAAYQHYNMMDKLYPYTFSCEEPPFKINKNGLPEHCGYCFFCLERWYAFGRIV